MNYNELQKRYEKVPQELKIQKRWVLYKVEQTNDGKSTKRPYNALNGQLARVNDQLTWTTFNIAINGCDKYNADGLGFILGNGIFGIDLDNHPNKDGEFEMNDEEFYNFANEFIDKLQSYTEYSQSGKGIHIICGGNLPEGSRRRGNVEMYDSGRFFAFTGNPILNVPIENREKEIVELWEKYINIEKPIFQAPSTTFYRSQNANVITLSDKEVIDSAIDSKNGDDFYRYYYQGDLSRNGGDASSADMSFCNMLAFWTNKNAQQMDRIFRSSALYRAKWDERRGTKTYGEITIDTAISMVGQGYEKVEYSKSYTIAHPEKVPPKKEEQKTIQEIVKPEEYVPEMNIDENGEPIFRIKKIFGNYGYNDTGNATRFYDYFGDLFKYNVTDKLFMFWTGTTWIRDTTNIIRKYANKLLEILKNEEQRMRDDIVEYTKSGDTIKAKQLEVVLDASIKNTTRLSNKAGKDAMLNEFQSLFDIPIESSEFNKDDYLLNTSNGIVDLRTGKILGFDRNKLCSKNTGVKVSYEPPTTWLKFLHEVFDNGNMEETQEIVDSLQTCLGYSLCGSTREQVMFLLYGSGSNGKSTLTEEIAYVMGDYGDNIASDVLMQKKASNNSTFSIAKLQTTRFVETGETDEGGKLAEAQIKILTGGDSISAQFKFGQEFSFKPKFKIWMSTNNKPIIRGTDLGIWRRVFLFPFENSFTGERKDKNLPEKLRQESDKILGWCIKGFLKYQELDDLIIPSSVQNAIKEYKEQMDVISQFINKCCKLGDGYSIESSKLYTMYKEWAEDNTEFKMKESKFTEELKKKGITSKKSSVGVFYYYGITNSGFNLMNRNGGMN